MLTRLVVRNFKRFENVEVELGQTVVFIGPNDSGKTISTDSAKRRRTLWALRFSIASKKIA